MTDVVAELLGRLDDGEREYVRFVMDRNLGGEALRGHLGSFDELAGLGDSRPELMPLQR